MNTITHKELHRKNMVKQVERIERLHLLIQRSATGTPLECAIRLDISKRQLYNVIELMREFGAPIYYNDIVKSYCYREEVEFYFGFNSKKKFQ